jgi:hypothetical protein
VVAGMGVAGMGVAGMGVARLWDDALVEVPGFAVL